MHRAHQVHVHHQPEVVQRHFGKTLVAQDAGVVDQDVDLAPGAQRLVDHRLHCRRIGHRRAIGQRLTACGNDLVHHRLSAAQVVDQHLGAARSQAQCMHAAQAAAGAGDDGYTASEVQSHRIPFEVDTDQSGGCP